MAHVVSDADVNEYTDDTAEVQSPKAQARETAPSGPATAPARGSSGGAARPHHKPDHRNAALHIPGLPVFLPEAALNPVVATGHVAPGNDRSRETLIVNRSERGKASLAARNGGSAGTGAKDLGLRDFSSYYDPVQPKYHKSYLNEVAFAETSKARMLEQRAIDAERAKRREAMDKAEYMKGGKLPGGKQIERRQETEGGGESTIPFFDRLEAVEKRKMLSREQTKLEYEYSVNPDKLSCPHCGQVQTFAEVQAIQRKCTKESCNGAHYRPKLLWTEVQDSFLGRWQEGQKVKDKHLADLLADPDVTPVTRVTSVTRYDYGSKRWTTTEVPERAWDDVRGAFYKRNDETIERLKARDAAHEAAQSAPVEPAVTQAANRRFKFSTPLPPFYERQMAMLEKRNMTFDERFEALKGL